MIGPAVHLLRAQVERTRELARLAGRVVANVDGVTVDQEFLADPRLSMLHADTRTFPDSDPTDTERSSSWQQFHGPTGSFLNENPGSNSSGVAADEPQSWLHLPEPDFLDFPAITMLLWLHGAVAVDPVADNVSIVTIDREALRSRVPSVWAGALEVRGLDQRLAGYQITATQWTLTLRGNATLGTVLPELTWRPAESSLVLTCTFRRGDEQSELREPPARWVTSVVDER